MFKKVNVISLIYLMSRFGLFLILAARH